MDVGSGRMRVSRQALAGVEPVASDDAERARLFDVPCREVLSVAGRSDKNGGKLTSTLVVINDKIVDILVAKRDTVSIRQCPSLICTHNAS